MEFEIENDLTSYGLARLGRGGPLYNSAEACYVGQPKADWISTGPSPVVWRACAHTVRSPRPTLARCTTTGDGTTALEAHDQWREREESSARVPGTVVGAGTHRVALVSTRWWAGRERQRSFTMAALWWWHASLTWYCSSRGGGGSELHAKTERREENVCAGGHQQEWGKVAALHHWEADNRPRGSEEELLEGSCADKRPHERKF
jgi:hypothetical protein